MSPKQALPIASNSKPVHTAGVDGFRCLDKGTSRDSTHARQKDCMRLRNDERYVTCCACSFNFFKGSFDVLCIRCQHVFCTSCERRAEGFGRLEQAEEDGPQRLDDGMYPSKHFLHLASR
jgi:hypothetical protein